MAKAKDQDRNAGLKQLPLPDDVTRALFGFEADGDVGSTEPLPPPKWIPPHHPTLEGHAGYSSTAWSEFDYWWAAIIVKDPVHGHWCHLYEWSALHNDWLPVTRVFGTSHSQADRAGRLTARRLLIEGQRPEAERQSPELARLVAFWREHGTHMLARDNG